MPDFKLTINIQTKDLKTIAANGQRIVIAKKCDDYPVPAWAVIDPFMTNIIEWKEDYGVFASQVAVFDGAVIYRLAEMIAKPMYNYPLTGYGAFDLPVKEDSAGPRQYIMQNNYQKCDMLTMGLEQAIQINGTGYDYKPINAFHVLCNQKFEIIPLFDIYVFLDNKITESMVTTVQPDHSALISYSGQVTENTVRYDAASGLFVLS